MSTETNTVVSLDIENTAEAFSLKIAFDLGPGITTLFGPSGAGKTMVLNAVAGLISPQAGRISLGGRVLFDAENHINLAPDKRRIGYVFQNGRLFPHLNVEDNLVYGRRFVPDDAPTINYNEVVDVLGIRPLLARRIHDLSGGESQRVAIGRALMTSPELLLMDEPLASLDPARRQEILPFIERLRDTFNLPIIYVSHSLDEVIRLADTAVMIQDGSIVARGEAEDILNRQELRPLMGLADPTRALSAPQTILTCKIAEHDRAFELSRLHGHGLSFWVPRLERAIGSHLRLQIRATDVALSLDEPENTSVLNRFRGTIETLDASRPGYADVEVRMETGVALWARVTQKSAMKLDLMTGHDVWCLVKSVAVARGTAEPVPPSLES
jgi:molybdate transport system ATP-binding protein